MIGISADRIDSELNLELNSRFVGLLSFVLRGYTEMKKKWIFTDARRDALNQAQLIAHRMKRHDKLNKMIADRRQNVSRGAQRFEAFINAK